MFIAQPQTQSKGTFGNIYRTFQFSKPTKKIQKQETLNQCNIIKAKKHGTKKIV